MQQTGTIFKKAKKVVKELIHLVIFCLSMTVTVLIDDSMNFKGNCKMSVVLSLRIYMFLKGTVILKDELVQER